MERGPGSPSLTSSCARTTLAKVLPPVSFGDRVEDGIGRKVSTNDTHILVSRATY